MKVGTTIVLGGVEQAICRALARFRHENNRKSGVHNAKMGGQSDWETDLEGIGAEFAFCKGFNLFPDFSIEIRSSQQGEDTGDAILPCGLRVDVKTTKYPTGRLLSVPWKKDCADVFALMVGVFPSYEFKGFMLFGELCRDGRLGDLGHGATYIASQDELRSLEEILTQRGSNGGGDNV